MVRGTVRCKAPASAEFDVASPASMKVKNRTSDDSFAAASKTASNETATNRKGASMTKKKVGSVNQKKQKRNNQANTTTATTRAIEAAGKHTPARTAPSARTVLGGYRRPARPGKPRIMERAVKAVSKVTAVSSVSQSTTEARTCLSRVCNAEGIMWAKLCGFPHWPARIVPHQERMQEASFRAADVSKRPADDTLVYFFGTHNVAWVNREKALRAWKSGIRKKFHSKPSRDKKGLRKALTEVRNYCRRKSKLLFLPQ